MMRAMNADALARTFDTREPYYCSLGCQAVGARAILAACFSALSKCVSMTAGTLSVWVLGSTLTKWSALALVVLCLAACATSEAPTSLRIASWNLEHLAEADGAGCRPRTESDYKKLRAYAAALNADVIGLQEVENAAAAQRVFPAEAYDVVMSDQPYPVAQVPCGQDGARVLTPQRTGIAIRRGVEYIVNPPLEALNVSNDPSRPVRWGVDVTLTGKDRLRLLDVHLKSGCSAGAKQDDEDCPVLFRQVPIVEQWIDARETEGEAFLILGDFNRRLGSHDAQVWESWNDDDPKGLELHIAAAEANATPQSPRCDDAKYKDFIDHLVFSKLAFARVQRASFAELVYSEVGDAMPSDHCPVSVVVKGG